ncbi:non-ribosomal peptide synthetase [Streptomyces sp. NRRL S-31]|uniref:non-ribosomal peptide synthetase n=1 Tax=Streptomyces sp. NRRL S-31 TaxID=1463898 RepID=UPI00069949AC|nr:non-ribosomal peptide synthetase [Streptomyces sp. NRRL S-31]
MTTPFQLSRALQTHPEQAEYWRSRLAAWEQPTLLPRDFLTHTPDPAHNRVVVPLPADRAARCRELTRDRSALAHVLTGAVLALLAARATDTTRVQVVTGHTDPGTGRATAFPLGLTVTRDGTLRTLLGAARAAYQEATGHLDIPVGHLLRTEGRFPTDLAAGADGELPAAEADRAGCVLQWDVRLRAARPRLVLRYRTDLFTRATAVRLAGAYVRLLTATTREPDAPFGPLLDADPAEREAIDRFNATAADLPADATLHGFLTGQAARTPERIAIRDDGTTYAELDRRTDRLAHRLREAGVRPGTIVGVCLPRGPLALTAVYAVLKAGGAYLPIDPTLPANRVAHLMEDSAAQVVVGDPAARAALPFTGTFVDATAPGALDGDAPAPADGAGPDDLCYVIYTSGSTGRPKGVMLEHRAVVNRLVWMQRAYPLTEDDVVLHKTPFTFDVSVWEIFWWALAGASVCTLPPGRERDPAALVARIAEHRVTTTHFVPSMLQAFLHYVAEDSAALATLRRVFASGEALGTPHALRFAELLTEPYGTSLVNLYGPTEAAVDVTHFPCADTDPRRPVPLGRPIDNLLLRVRTRAGTTAPIGTPGELCVGGAGLARGYLGSPELTAERFTEDPELPGGRIYRTGDLARWLPDGTLEYLGRLDTQIKIRGYRVEPAEIEHVAEGTPGVTACAVVAVADPAGHRRLCAYVVPGDGYDEEALRDRLATELPPYMVPGTVVTVPAIPTTHNGKRDTAALPPPRPAAPRTRRRAPAGETAVRLADIWARVLGVRDIGLDDNFFALGGDSIMMVRVLAEARRAGLDFSFQDLFAHPTLAALEPRVRREGQDPGATRPLALLAPADVPRLPPDAQDAYPLSALQTGLLYEVELTGHRPGLYHDIVSFRVPEPPDPEAFRAAAALVAARHPMLRTSLHVSGYSQPVQIVHGDTPDPVEVTDLSHLDEAARERALDDHYARELARGFRPETGGLVRVALHLLGEQGYQYSLSYHAAALDGWSVSVVHHDLFAAYLALRAGRAPSLTPLGTGYQDFVRLEREAAASAASRAFWDDLLDGHEGGRLPRLPGAAGTDGVAQHDVPLPDGVPAGVTRVAGQLNVPVKSVLMAAHLAVLALVTGTDDVLTGYEHSGRPETADGDRVTGLFLNTVPFRVRVGDGSWADLVRAAYRAETALLPHRRYPMSEMKRHRSTREPLFEAVFNFTHFHVLDELRREHGLRLERGRVASETEFPFRAEFWQDAFTGTVALSLHHHPGEFPPEQIQRIAGYYRRALELLVTDPDAGVRDVSLLGGPERALLADFAGPARELPPGGLLGLFAAQVAARPRTTAVQHGTHTLDYRELDDRSARLAARLAAAGVRPGDVVAVPMDRGIPWAVTVLAVLRLGAVYLPQDPGDPAERLRAMLTRSACRHVLTTAGHRDTLERALAAADGTGPAVLDYAEPADGDDDPAPARPAVPGPAPAPADPAYLIFTSGSTGEPKGALVHHRGMLNHLLAKTDALRLTGDDVVAQVATQCFDISVWQLLAAWLVGGRTVIYGADVVTDLPAFAQALQDDAVSVLEVVPSFLDALLGELDLRPRELTALRWNLVTGEAFPPALSRRWFDRYDVPMVNAYGPTETSDDVTHHILTAPATGKRVPVGRPIANTGIHVVGPDGRHVPVGTYGEILVTGTAVGLGYLNDPERTARAFVPNTLDDTSAVLYRTGDIGRWLPGGVLDCAGRRDHQTKVRGHRVEPGEVEGALARVPGVDHAVVLPRRDGGRDLLAAWYTGTADPRPEALRAALARFLPRYLLPDVFERLDAFPVTRNGKVDRAALGRRPLDTAVRPAAPPPENEAEAGMTAAFADVLGLPVDRVGVTDSFFDLGGHSLAAMRLAARLPGGLTLRDVVAHPTARALARRAPHPTAPDRAGEPLTDLTGLTGLTVNAGPGPDGPPATVVCFPFAGGTPASYLELTRALHRTGAPVRVLAADYAGTGPAGLAALLAGRAEGPLVLLGHSAGAAPALDTAFALRAAGRAPDHVFLVASVPRADAPGDPREHLGRTDEEVLDWLARNAGPDAVTALPADRRHRLAEDFRQDTAAAARSWARLSALPPQAVLDGPVTLLLADDDPLTRDHAQHAHRWARFTGAFTLSPVAHGGHHLNATRPDLLAEQVRKAVGP